MNRATSVNVIFGRSVSLKDIGSDCGGLSNEFCLMIDFIMLKGKISSEHLKVVSDICLDSKFAFSLPAI